MELLEENKLSEQANIVYQEDLNVLLADASRIMKFISHHFTHQRPRLKMLDKYYKDENKGISERKSRADTGKADYRASHSFAKYIADFQASYSVGNPINVKLPTDANADRFNEIMNANDIDAHNYDLFLDMTKLGRAYEYIYRGGDNVEHLVRLDPLETFVIYSLDVDPKPIMAVRYHQVELVDDDGIASINYAPEYWTANEHVKYKPTPIDGALTPITDGIESNNEHVITFPVVEYKNNNIRFGDYENVISLIDLYDAAQSDTANYMTDLNDAMLVISGDIDTLFDGSDILQGVDPNDTDAMKKLAKDKLDILQEMKDANLLLLKSGFNANGGQTTTNASYIHKEYDVTGTEAYKKRLANDIHKFSHTPDLTDENFASNSSGIAMKYKVLGTVELAATKRRMFEKGLYQRLAIISEIESKASTDLKLDLQQVQFTFRDNLPIDDIGQIQQLTSAGATLPQKYLYQFLPNVTDPDEIAKMMAEQPSEFGLDRGEQDEDAPTVDEGIRRRTSESGQEQQAD